MFTVTVGTYLESSKIPLSKWFHAVYVFSSHKKGISSCQLAKDIGVTQKTAWFILSRLREVMKEEDVNNFENEALTQIDETYYAGRHTNRHFGKLEFEKQTVIGFAGQTGVVSLVHVPNVTGLKKLIASKIPKGSTMVTDGNLAYSHLKYSHQHYVVDHSIKEYVNDAGFHTNTVEGVFSHLKRGITGIYHHVSPKHLQKYCNEFSFRLSTRKISERSRFDYALSKIAGRLSYNNLIAPSEFSRYPQVSSAAIRKHNAKKVKAAERGLNFLENNKRKDGQNPTSQD
ncbi:MAG: IS1595 family transposase [Bacteroidetes bacterium]|nr:IS1595 family transposase [Bacteroidota bacterium]